jgi:cell division protein FtsW
MILAGVFINIASMVGLMPLNGTPLLFISQGGTALLLVLIEAGIILNISKYLPRQN